MPRSRGLAPIPFHRCRPARHEAPVYFDVATSAIAGNKVRLAARVGAPLLPGWVADRRESDSGRNAGFRTRPVLAFTLGGTREQGSHKGYGFALMAEIMSSMLAGALPAMLDAQAGYKHYLRPITSRRSSIWIGSKTPWTACFTPSRPPNQQQDTSAFSTQVYPNAKMSRNAAPTASLCTGK